MCWPWARSPCAGAVVAPAKPHGQVQGSGSAQLSSTVPTGTLADLPRGTNTAILALVEKQALCSSCQLLSHRELGFPKSCFSLDLFSAAGLDPSWCPHSHHREPVPTPLCAPCQARTGLKGQTTHGPPHHAHPEGNSPEPGGPRSVQGRTGREPRALLTHTAPPSSTVPTGTSPSPPQGTHGSGW